MSISRLTRQRLYEDEALFNQLLPYVKWDYENLVFVHSDASLWSIFQLQPLLLTSASEANAFQTCQVVQELIDSLDDSISAQFSWISTFDVENLLDHCIHDYPLSGVGGWNGKTLGANAPHGVTLFEPLSSSEETSARRRLPLRSALE